MKLRALFLAALLSSAQTVFAASLSIRADYWFPMNGNPADPSPGYMIELVTDIMKQHNVTVDYQTMPWERALQMTREGKIDCVVGAYKGDAPDLLFPEEAWGIDTDTFYVRNDSNWTYNGLESLVGQKVGLISGYSYGDESDAFIKAHKEIFQPLGGDTALEQNIKKLMSGRVTAIVDSELVLKSKLKKLGLVGQLKSAGPWGEPDALYIACSPNRPTSKQYLQWIDEGTRQLRASGRLKAIMESYGLEDWQKQ